MKLRLIWKDKKTKAVYEQQIEVENEKLATAYARGSKRNTKARLMAWTIEK